jgi:putative transposase
VTFHSGDMGDTSPPRRGHALEGVSRGDERLRFVARLEGGETMTALCAEFGSHGRPATRFTTGIKKSAWRASPIGVAGRIGTRISCRPRSRSDRPLEAEYPSWGAPKLRERLRQRYPALQCPPSVRSTPSSIGTTW